MAQNINKLIVGNEVLFDLSGDTVTPDKLAVGITAHDKSGKPIIGTMTTTGNNYNYEWEVYNKGEIMTEGESATIINRTLSSLELLVSKEVKIVDGIITQIEPTSMLISSWYSQDAYLEGALPYFKYNDNIYKCSGIDKQSSRYTVHGKLLSIGIGKADYIDTVSSNSELFPADGESGNYWFVKK